MNITDRAKDVIKSGGEWISSVDLENAIMGHPAVAEAAVIGIVHPKWDERPILLVVPRPGRTPQPDAAYTMLHHMDLTREDDGWVVTQGPLARIPEEQDRDYRAMVEATRDYVGKSGFKSVLLGLSGGVDSALTLAIAVDALGAGRVRALRNSWPRYPWQCLISTKWYPASAAAQAASMYLPCRYRFWPSSKCCLACSSFWS